MGLRLGIDLDGVVADFNAGWMQRYNAEHSSDLMPAQVTMWDDLHSLTHFKDMAGFWDWAQNHGGATVFRHLEPYAHAIDTLQSLTRRGHKIVIVTAKPDWAVHDTLAWLSDHRIPTREVHAVADKWTVECDVYLDDSPYVVPDLVRHRGDSSTICRFVRPWNDPVEGARDVRSWREFEGVVDLIGAG